MTTTPEATKGVPRLEANPAPTLRADYNALADWVRDNTNRGVASIALLPATGNWVDRIVKTTDTTIEYRWNGTAWKPHNSDFINWTTTLSAGAGVFAVGNGTLTARYQWVNGQVSWLFRLLLGTTSTIGTNSAFTLPITAETAISAFSVQGRGTLGVTNGSQVVDGVSYRNGTSATTVIVGTWNVAATYQAITGISATIPFGWGSGCYIELVGTYQPA